MSLYAGIVLLPRVFEKRRGLAAGIGMAGGGVGTMIFGVVIPLLIHIVDLQWTLRILASVVACGNITSGLILTVPDVIPPRNQDQRDQIDIEAMPTKLCELVGPTGSNLVSDCSLIPAHSLCEANEKQTVSGQARKASLSRTLYMKNACNEQEQDWARNQDQRTSIGSCGLRIRGSNMQVLLVFAGVFVGAFGLYTPILFMVAFAQQHTEQPSSILVSYLGIGSIVCRVALSSVSDYIGRLVTAISVLYVYGIATVCAGSGVFLNNRHTADSGLMLYVLLWYAQSFALPESKNLTRCMRLKKEHERSPHK